MERSVKPKDFLIAGYGVTCCCRPSSFHSATRRKVFSWRINNIMAMPMEEMEVRFRMLCSNLEMTERRMPRL